jgi:diguanylate cyclase (GGDEF)-like protein
MNERANDLTSDRGGRTQGPELLALTSTSTEAGASDDVEVRPPEEAPGVPAWHASHQRTLDELVTRVAVELMSVSTDTLQSAFAWTLGTLADFFGMDTVFLRSHDQVAGLSILVDEYPRRLHVPDPDPIGVVPFDADPQFGASRHLKEPFVVRPISSAQSYQQRVEEASGVVAVSTVIVPLLHEDETTGIMGFVKFGDRPWLAAEINALRAIASLVVQLQARIDAEERLRYSAMHDELTGLANRRVLLAELDRRLAAPGGAAVAEGPAVPSRTALLFLDLDRFKSMNDFLGHRAGDRLLVAIARRIEDALRPGDFAARLGGDEFVVLLDGDVTALEASAVAGRVLELVAQSTEVEGHHVIRTGSMGIAFAAPGEATAEELLSHADAALYTAKSRGRNQAVVFDDALRAAVDERSKIEMQLREVIDSGGLQLYYHPEIDLRNGRLLACEALVRWQHPVRGLLPAGAFITVAEETGLIVDLGRWVLDEACRQMAQWMRRHPESDLEIRVNVSPAQLVSRNIVHQVAECLDRYSLPGRRLCLEITEHAVMQDVDRAIGILHELRNLGVHLAIDDFGTGFSSMAQLKRLPVDTLKVDRSFVTGLGTDRSDRAIVESIVRLAEAFDLDTVAEGVETVDHIEQLLELGCYRSQGFLLCKPVPATVMEPLIRAGGMDLNPLLRQAA